MNSVLHRYWHGDLIIGFSPRLVSSSLDLRQGVRLEHLVCGFMGVLATNDAEVDLFNLSDDVSISLYTMAARSSQLVQSSNGLASNFCVGNVHLILPNCKVSNDTWSFLFFLLCI